MESFALRLFGAANPVWCLQAVQSKTDCTDVLGLFRLARTIYGDPASMGAALGKARERLQDSAACTLPSKTTPRRPAHVFPVAVTGATGQAGLMVPMLISRHTEWVVSDAFGRLGAERDPTPDPRTALLGLLGQIERAWKAKYSSELPARWLCPLQLRLGCPVHLDLVDGKSLQFPLVVALVRALAAGRSGQLPFGDGPVFATGTVLPDSTVGWVEQLPLKVEGFLREYGTGTAVLTPAQHRFLEQNARHLLNGLNVQEVESLDDLMGLGPIRAGLDALRTAYHPSMNEVILEAMPGLARSIHFAEIRQLADWSEGHVTTPYYRFRFAIEASFTAFHKGDFFQAMRLLQPALDIFDAHPNLVGADDLGRLFTVCVNAATDAHTPAMVEHLLPALDQMLGRMRLLQRAQVAGALCQYFRFFDCPDRPMAAVEWGRRAVGWADAGYTSGAGRSRNYLIHSLLVTYRSMPEDNLIKEADALLGEAETVWAPQSEARAYRPHMGFCLHLRAELMRLRRQPFQLPPTPPWGGDWGHPWLFALLACARNEAHALELRIALAQQLCDEANSWTQREGEKSLFGLFSALYALYYAHLVDADPAEPLDCVRGWLSELAERELPGWQIRLNPYLDALSAAATDKTVERAMDELLNAVRYH